MPIRLFGPNLINRNKSVRLEYTSFFGKIVSYEERMSFFINCAADYGQGDHLFLFIAFSANNTFQAATKTG
jgi:hypothetical protein